MSEPPKKITAEYLGTTKLNNGQLAGELRRELDPNGSVVVHAVRKSPYVHDRWHSAGKLDPDLYAAAERFRMDFERAGLQGSYARLDIFKARAGQQEMTDRTALAKVRVGNALSDLGKGPESPSVSCVWSVIGLGLNLDQWTEFYKRQGGHMNADRAAGVLHSSIERLGIFYGIVDPGKLANIRSDAAFSRGVKYTNELISTLTPRPEDTAMTYAARVRLELTKRLAKHLR